MRLHRVPQFQSRYARPYRAHARAVRERTGPRRPGVRRWRGRRLVLGRAEVHLPRPGQLTNDPACRGRGRVVGGLLRSAAGVPAPRTYAPAAGWRGRARARDGRDRAGRLPGRPWQRAHRPDQRLRGHRPALRGTQIQARPPDRQPARRQAPLARPPRASLTSPAPCPPNSSAWPRTGQADDPLNIAAITNGDDTDARRSGRALGQRRSTGPVPLQNSSCAAWLAGSRSRLRGSVVLADHAAGYLPALYGCIGRQDGLRVVVGRSLLAGLVRAVTVVVAGVLSGDRPEVLFVVDEHPVGALGSCGPHPPLGIAVRPRRPRRSPDNPHALAGQDLVEGSPGTLRASKTLSPRCGCGRKACSAWRRPLSC